MHKPDMTQAQYPVYYCAMWYQESTTLPKCRTEDNSENLKVVLLFIFSDQQEYENLSWLLLTMFSRVTAQQNLYFHLRQPYFKSAGSVAPYSVVQR